MRGKKAKFLRKVAVAEFPPAESQTGFQKGTATWWGPQWRRYHRHLKRYSRKGGK